MYRALITVWLLLYATVGMGNSTEAHGLEAPGKEIHYSDSLANLWQNGLPEVSATVNPASCNTPGSIMLTLNDQTPPYTYVLYREGIRIDSIGPTPLDAITFENLGAGEYQISVTDSSNFSYSDTLTVSTTDGFDLQAQVLQGITCTEGTIQLNPLEAASPILYAIWSYENEAGDMLTSYDSPADIPEDAFQDSALFNIDEAGYYTFIGRDSRNCYAISNPVYIQLEPAIDYVRNVFDAACGGVDETGSFNLTIISLNGYEVVYTLINPDGSEVVLDSPRADNLPPGDYEFVISQTQGSLSCDYVEQFTIRSPGVLLTADLVPVQELNCIQEGILEIQNISGGAPPFEYSIDGLNYNSGPGGNRFRITESGNFNGYIRDTRGCVYVTPPVRIEPFDFLSDLEIQSSTVGCSDTATDLTMTISGGTGPYQFEIVAPSIVIPDSVSGRSATFIGLAPGDYTILVTDSAGCPLRRDYTVFPAEGIGVITQELNPVSCFGGRNGSVSVALSNLSNSYSYTLTGPATNLTASSNSESLTFSGLSEGDYRLSILEDITLCAGELDFSISSPVSALSLEAIDLPECPEADSVEIQANGGWGFYEFTLIYPDQTTTVTTMDGIFSSLEQNGEYTVRVTDSQGCSETTNFSLSTAFDFEITPEYSCTGTGPANRIAFTYGSETNSSEWLYALDSQDPSDYLTDPDFSNLQPGDHYISVLNSSGCELSVPFEILESNPIELSLIQQELNRISVRVTGGNPPFNFFFNNLDYGNQNEFEATEDGSVSIRVSDASGCNASASIELLACEDPTPDFFTPDGDAVDDVWIPGCLNRIPDARTAIYDRYGRRLYVIRRETGPWDGSFAGTDLPTGDYWYVIRYSLGELEREITGHVTLMR